MLNTSGRLFDPSAIMQPGQFKPAPNANKFFQDEGGGDASTLRSYGRQDRYAIYQHYRKDQQRVDAGGKPSAELTSSYDALRSAIPGQAARAAKVAAPNFTPVGTGLDNNYSNAQDMVNNDIAKGKVTVAPTKPGEETVAWDNPTNDKFRALHDTMGHGGAGTTFSHRGETIAADAHRRTLPKSAHRALTSEVVGQATVHEFTGDFVDQKGLYDVPDWAAKGEPRPLTSPKQFAGQPKPRQGRLF